MQWQIMLVALVLCCGMVAAAAETLEVWAVDPLEKVFRDAMPVDGTAAIAHAARGETVDFQFVARGSSALDALRVEVSPFVHEGGKHTLQCTETRFVGYVNVDRPTQRPSADQLRKPPFEYPDVLLEDEQISLAADTAQPFWVSLTIPVDAAPGVYVATASVTGDDKIKTVVPLKVYVYPVTIEKTRLWVTNWFSMNWKHMDIAPEPESEEYYALLRRFARNMAEYRQNVALISPLNLANYTVDASGALTFDFSRFDRWVQIFIEEGCIGRIEGGHIGGRMGGWESDFGATVRLVRDGKVVSERVNPDSEEARNFYSSFFPALVAHLKEKGWLDIYMQHLADEPTSSNFETYKALAALARTYAPELRIIEATHSKDLTGSIDVWVPQLNYFHENFEHYQERQKAGDEIWFYTCVFPQGEYANRFIEQPLIKTRLLHWINFKYGATGYLHWGYNHWTGDDPTTHTTRPHGGPPYLPAGDPWVVYPGKNGPLASIRFAAMRDGVVDYELLSMLSEKNNEQAWNLAAKLVLDFDKYNTDIKAFREIRKEILQLLSEE